MPIKCKPYLGPDDPVIIEALSPVFRSSQTIFFTIGDDGKHTTINVGERLYALGISWANVATVIQSYPFKILTYESPSKLAIAAGKGKPKGHGPQAAFKDAADHGEVEEEVPEIGGKNKKQRYQLVQQGKYYGCYDGIDATVVLFASAREARMHIYDRLHSRDAFHSFYGGKFNHKPRELQQVD
jgi:hypothetical protein